MNLRRTTAFHLIRNRHWRRLLATVIVAGIGTLQQAAAAASEGEYPDPMRFQKPIAAFAAEDEQQPPPVGAVVCTGSSSIRMWHPTIAADLAPITVIPRGFGGSTMNDLLHYADCVILQYRPRAVVIYEGDNDVAQNISPAKIHATFQDLVAKLHRKEPEIRIYFLAIKPSVARQKLWPQAAETNRLIAAVCAGNERLTYVDVATPMMHDNGTVRQDLFLEDNLHMNRAGYEIWRDVLRPILMQQEAAFEQ